MPADSPALPDRGHLLAGAAGDHLVACGLIGPDQREAAIALARHHGLDPMETLAAQGPPAADREALAAALAACLGLVHADPEAEPPDPALPQAARLGDYSRHLLLPWRRQGAVTRFLCVSPDLANLVRAEAWAGGPVELAVTSRPALMAALARHFAAELGDLAINRLRRRAPEHSAGTPAPRWQKRGLGLLLLGTGAGLALAPVATLAAASAVTALFYFAHLLFRLAVVVAGQRRGAAAAAPPLPDPALPPYTILAPLLREPEVLPLLADALDRLDYPRALLDIKLVLEADDAPTIAEARRLGLDRRYDLVLVPPSEPRTKPKACNFALPLARGDCLVIFDAEDRPESDQLRKAAGALVQGPAGLGCVQARLNFDNARENWLTRMFALDYALWFDYLLPGLDRLGIPIPLGGTSNHFRLAALQAVEGWDPFNVTEDADLGLRLHARGFRVGVIDSTTFEEATSTLGNWLRQRSRWMKGYMQTMAVQARHPLALWRRAGPVGALGVFAFVGGTVAASLANPLVWGLCLAWLATHGSGWLDPLFPPPVTAIGLMSWGLGNFTLLYLAMIAPFRRGWFGLTPWALTTSFYWILVSVAAWRALWQWLHRPFHWEKTQHGASRHIRAILAQRERGGPRGEP
ncbi:glycosyltransferase family 2 protein [Zavarzinia compransoris]|uniref:Glycosyltransferase n=1 Tax=Zavarzinia compransoris TaxID=1264899 RepID=A0A317E348_9PROT|nr:glycosyltransferase [Zavarzinia compransoris]PWR20864.1 glycosyltransferase [Zavarzinia compransoris]TDP44300.1 cellulose synthase/poly-beta-1,6-N-acetylglucosamine synthase-like glycosyltransferase [Zavarzinia compransoris]